MEFWWVSFVRVFLFMFASTLGEGGNWVKWMVIGGDCEQQFRSVEKIDLVSE